MPLKIRYVNGPNAGTELVMGDDKEEIRFGRSVGADVSFPEDLSVVSHEHFGLRKEYGGYKFIINPEKPVFMDGRPLYDDQALPKEAEVTLGTMSGPKLRFERTEAHGANQVKTAVLRPQSELAHDMRTTQSRGNRTAGIVGAVVLVVAVLAAAGYFISQSLKTDVTTVQGSVTKVQGDVATAQGDIASVQQQVTKINTDIPAVRQQLAQLQNSNIDAAAIIAKNKESVYLVRLMTAGGQEYSSATASVVLLPNGQKALATNGHVGEMYNDLLNEPEVKGGKLIAVQSKGPDYPAAEIISVKIHPGYAVFGAWQGSYEAKKAIMAAQPMDFSVPGYDVALLFVAEPEKLGPPITMASRETIEALRAGDGLVTIGYPAEGLVGTDHDHPDPTSQTGRVVSLTTFFLQTGSDATNQLVQHSAPSAGGASGSAMFNAKGEVVAFLNAGNIAQVQTENGARVSSAALVNYAQRADLMLDLIEDKAKDKVEDIKKGIAEADARLTLTPDQQQARIIDTMAIIAKGKDNVAEAGTFEGDMATPLPELNSPKNFVNTFDVQGDGLYFFLLRSEDGRPVIGALLANGKQKLGQGAGVVSFVAGNVKAGTKLTMVAVDFNAATGQPKDDTTGKVKVTVYKLPFQEN